MNEVNEMKSPFTIQKKRPALWNVFTVVGLITVGAIVIPAFIGLVVSAPDIQRYLRISRM
jgi:hypothetical protein